MIVFNVIVTALNGRQRNIGHLRGQNVYQELLIVPHTQAWLDEVPTPELLHKVKVGWSDTMNVYRLCCLALSSYMVWLSMTIALLVFYAIPNQLYLMDHLCRMFPDEPLDKDQERTHWGNIQLLRKIGLPRNLKGSKYAAFKKTWMMTMIGHSQSILLLGGVLAFSVPPFYLFFVPWANAFEGRSSDHQVMFIVAYTISVAFLTAGWITGLSATLTFDDIFRVVSGMGNAQTEVVSDHAHSGSGQNSRRLTRNFPGSDFALSPISPSFAKTVQSPTSSGTPGYLRPMPSFSLSTADTEKGDTCFEDYAYESNGSRLFVVTETVVRVDHSDLEVTAAGPDSMPMYPHPYNPTTSPPPASSPYSFLTRSAGRDS